MNDISQGLNKIRDSRNKENRAASNGTALALYDCKAQKVTEIFGQQKTKPPKATVRDQAAYMYGREEAAKINISTNRPLNGPTAHKQLS